MMTQTDPHDDELVECFHNPAVPDIAQVHPAAFVEYQRRLRALEWVDGTFRFRI